MLPASNIIQRMDLYLIIGMMSIAPWSIKLKSYEDKYRHARSESKAYRSFDY
jgi:hypothetical protein